MVPAVVLVSKMARMEPVPAKAMLPIVALLVSPPGMEVATPSLRTPRLIVVVPV